MNLQMFLLLHFIVFVYNLYLHINVALTNKHKSYTFFFFFYRSSLNNFIRPLNLLAKVNKGNGMFYLVTYLALF